MSVKFWIAGSSLALALGCASITGEYVATPVTATHSAKAWSSALLVSAEEVTALSSPYLGVVVLTFENRSVDFIRIDAVSLDFGDAEHNRNVSLPLGKDLASWAAAVSERNAIRDHNTQLALSTLALSGAVVSALGRDEHAGVSALGAGTALAAMTALSISELDTRGDELRTSGLLPDNHLLAGPFSVPPALFAKKWLVLRSSVSTRCVERMILSIHLQGTAWQQLRVRFRTGAMTLSEWQRRACRG